MARKKTVLKSRDTRRRYTDEFKEEAVQMMLAGHTALSVMEPLFFRPLEPCCGTLFCWCPHCCQSRLNMCRQATGILLELERSCRFLSAIPAAEPGYQPQTLAAHSSAR